MFRGVIGDEGGWGHAAGGSLASRTPSQDSRGRGASNL